TPATSTSWTFPRASFAWKKATSSRRTRWRTSDDCVPVVAAPAAASTRAEAPARVACPPPRGRVPVHADRGLPGRRPVSVHRGDGPDRPCGGFVEGVRDFGGGGHRPQSAEPERGRSPHHPALEHPLFL